MSERGPTAAPDLVDRLRAIAPLYVGGPHEGFSPEDVARGLEAAQDRFAALWMAPQQINAWDAWASIREAFVVAAGANPKEGI